MTKREDPAKYERERRAKNPERTRAASRQNYAKHREKRLAEKRAKRDSDPEADRAYQRAQYAKHRNKRVAEARAKRLKNREALAAQAKAKYRANRDAIIARRKELFAQSEDRRAKRYAGVKAWSAKNPDKLLIQRAKVLLADQTGLRPRDIPNGIAEAKAEQLKISRWVREQKTGKTPDAPSPHPAINPEAGG